MDFLRQKFTAEYPHNKAKYLVVKNAELKLTPDRPVDLMNESLKYPVVFGSLEGVQNDSAMGKLDYEWRPIYRPRIGQVIFVYHPHISDNLRLPTDGYVWPSPVQTHKVKDIATSKELQIFTQPDGSDGSIVLAKRIYHFAPTSGDPGFIMIHYVTNEAVQQFLTPKPGSGQRVPSQGVPQMKPNASQPQMSKQAPTVAAVPPALAGAASGRLQGIKGQATPAVAPTPTVPGTNLTQQQLQQQQILQRQQQNSENLETFVAEKQIALGRYCQNHEFLEELFNPTSVGQLMESMKTQSQSVTENKSIFENLSKKRADIEEEIVQMNKRYKEDLKQIEADTLKWSQYMKQLDTCTTPQDLDALSATICGTYEIEFHDKEQSVRRVL